MWRNQRPPDAAILVSSPAASTAGGRDHAYRGDLRVVRRRSLEIMTLETVSLNRSHGGVQGVYRHASRETRTAMTFSVYVPAASGRREAAGGLVSVRPDLHPRQRHRKGRISPAPAPSSAWSLSRRTPARAAKACRAIPPAPMISGLAPASMSMPRSAPFAEQLPDVELCDGRTARTGRRAFSGRSRTGNRSSGIRWAAMAR